MANVNVEDLNPTARRVLAYVREHPGCTHSEIWAALSGLTRGQVSKAAATLFANGLVGRQPRIANAPRRTGGSGWRFYPEAVAHRG